MSRDWCVLAVEEWERNHPRGDEVKKPWQHMNTLPDSDDLVWVARYRADFYEYEGPMKPTSGMVDYWDYWCYVEPPSFPAPPRSAQRRAPP